MHFIGLVLEAFFFGFYSGIFAMYLECHASKKDTNKAQNVFCFSMCALYVLSVVSFVCDIATCTRMSQLLRRLPLLHIIFIGTTSFGCSDFIAQCILLYRCWIVWGRNTRVVIIPSILTLTFLATWLLYSISVLLSNQLVTSGLGKPVFLTSLAMSLTVNAFVTGLIVFRIFKVFREIKVTWHDQILASSGGNKLRRIIFILIESGMALFSIQLARLVVTILWREDAYRAFNIIVGVHQMLNGITPTIILVRTSMGLSFHDEKSMEEVAIGSVRFISIISQDSRDDDDIEIGRCNDINIIER